MPSPFRLKGDLLTSSIYRLDCGWRGGRFAHAASAPAPCPPPLRDRRRPYGCSASSRAAAYVIRASSAGDSPRRGVITSKVQKPR